MKKPDIQGLILDLEVKKEKLEEQYRHHRDEMYLAEGAFGEIELLIWKLEKLK